MSVNQILETAAGWAGGPPMLILLVGTHLYLTVRLRFIQRYLGHAIRISLQRGSEGAGDVLRERVHGAGGVTNYRVDGY